MKLLMATENGAQELRVKVREKGYYTMFSRLLDFHFWVNSQGGTQQISEILADRIGRKNIHLEQPVASISQSDESDLVTVKTLSAKIFR
jgi:monoamine oxidase